MIGLNKETFIFFILICLYANFACILLGLAVSAFTPTIEAAHSLGPLLMFMNINFGGFYIRIKSLPLILKWFPYLSIFQWAFRALLTNEVQGLQFTCNNVDTSKCILTGEEVLSTLDFDGHSTSYGIFGLGMLMLVYLLILYLFLELSNIRYINIGYIGNKYVM